MSASAADAYRLLRQLRRELTGCQVRVTEIVNVLGAIGLEDEESPVEVCPHCTGEFGGPLKLAEHLYISHDGPEPPQWVELEAALVPALEAELVEAAS